MRRSLPLALLVSLGGCGASRGSDEPSAADVAASPDTATDGNCPFEETPFEPTPEEVAAARHEWTLGLDSEGRPRCARLPRRGRSVLAPPHGDPLRVDVPLASAWADTWGALHTPLVEGGWFDATFESPAGPLRVALGSDRRERSASVRVGLLEEDGRQVIRLRAPEEEWALRWGCEVSSEASWPWVPGDRRDLVPWIDRARAAIGGDPARLVLRIETAAGAPFPTVGDVLDLLRTIREGCAVERLVVEPPGPSRREEAVGRALRWLAASQGADGAWTGASGEVGGTGLALLAFLVAGYTNRGTAPFAKTVSNGVRWLRQHQRPDGLFAETDGRSDLRDDLWATLALVRVYGMTESPVFRGAAVSAYQAVDWSAALRHRDPLVAGGAAILLATAARIADDARARGKDAPWARADAPDAAFVLDLAASLGTHPAARWFGAPLPPHPVGSRRARDDEAQRLANLQRSGALRCFGGSWDPPADAGPSVGRLETTGFTVLALEVREGYAGDALRGPR